MRAVRVERHAHGPRVYILGRRAHDYHLGFFVLGVLLLGLWLGGWDFSLATQALALAGFWLVMKDWRDLFPSKRDTSTWTLGIHRPARSLRTARRASWLPTAAAFVAGSIGAVNVLCALTPDIGWRRHLLLSVEPMSAVPIFHAVVLPAGAALVLAALFLKRRRRRAWQAAFFVLLALGALDLAKGLDVEEALLSWAGAAALWWGREAFDVRHSPGSARSFLWQVPGIAFAVGALSFLTVWALAPNEPGMGTIARDTADLLSWSSGPIAFQDERSWVPLGVRLLGLAALLFAARLVFRPLAAARVTSDRELRQTAARLVHAHGSDTLSFFKLRQDTDCFFSRDRRAFVGYAVEGSVLLISGDPVGPPDALPALVRELCAFAEVRGLKIGAVGASEQLLPLYREAGLRSLYIGDEAIVDTRSFSLDGRPIRKVRQSVTRLGKAGYSAHLHRLGELDSAKLAELEGVSASWLEGAPERGFSMAMDSLRGEHLADSVVVVARDSEGVARGFLHFVPSYRRPAMSLSAMRWDRCTPNGLNEFLVVESIELLRARRIEEVSLNFAAFARLLHDPRGPADRLLGRLIALGNRYFQIESLYRFNAKFFPRWVPRYLVYESVLSLPRTGLAVLWVEGQLPRPRLPALALARART